jgi:pimeloyl-ACP methyl ester carboxylesterase
MKTELVAIKTKDDLLLHGAFYEGNREKPAVIVMHGSQMNFYMGLGSFLPPIFAEQGYPCLTANFRGHDVATAPDGYSRKIVGAIYDNFPDCALDLEALLKFVRERGHDRVILLGHSQGVFKILYAQHTLRDQNVAGLALISPPPSAEEMTVFLIGRKEYERALTEARQAIRDDDPFRLIVSPARGNLPFVFSALTYISFCDNEIPVDARHLCRSIETPILVTRGTLDLPPVTKELVESIKENCQRPDQCRLAELEGAGHLYNGHEKILSKTLIHWMETLI